MIADTPAIISAVVTDIDEDEGLVRTGYDGEKYQR